jgi:hypothetical protein
MRTKFVDRFADNTVDCSEVVNRYFIANWAILVLSLSIAR